MTLEGLRKLILFINGVDFVLFVSFYGDEYKDLNVDKSRKQYLLGKWTVFKKDPIEWLDICASIEVRQRFLKAMNNS